MQRLKSTHCEPIMIERSLSVLIVEDNLALAAKDQLDDKLLGFESGADDYIVKPLALPELEIRLRVLAARSHKRSDVRPVLEVADLCFDLGT
ncbi:DNA-binding response regulator [Pseudomonas syringae pv. theae ICMP 3923]|uniref:DNA-binding response regulator n=1 Tax=Pseudomonas syringae pv. theae TaxID=103985 RepID=A0A3M5MTU0_PSESX|nr:response regulator transcription factor [Pseudomonas syringae]EPM69917.1 DNA-binding response regulator [Pseudomonas syringae pv. theae ICMP 3923]RMT63112.1 DNA-binding response regulator [Pseudomonas syringae pv. theae]